METVAFYSYKGGVGRTLLVANTAQFLAMSGRRVVALDLDLEAPGLHHKLGNADVLSRAQSGTLSGAVDLLLDTLGGEPSSRGVREIAVAVDLPLGSKGSLFLIPAGSAPSHAYWAALERLKNAVRSPGRNGGLLEATLELQARIADEFNPDFLLIDSRTGITELGGLATSTLADRVVCLTTLAPESVEGTRVVAEALWAAPRFASQKPLRIDFLITRVEPGSTHSSGVSRIIQELGGSVGVLPHDSEMAIEERVWSGRKAGRVRVSYDEYSNEDLFSATLTWIAESFPGHKQEAESARRRMQSVHRTWRHLTHTSKRGRGGTVGRAAWQVEQLRERVTFGSGEDFRQADIVAYDGPPERQDSKPLIVIEYVDREDRDSVALWWLNKIQAPVVAILSEPSDYRLYSNRAAWDSRARHSDRRDLPLPHDFEVLSDPTDVSIDALLDSVRRGHPEYLERIVTDWVHCSASSLHGGALWKPHVAKNIIDGLARVDDLDLAKRVLRATFAGSSWSGTWLGDGDEFLDGQVLAELFTPLLWRLPPQASIEFMGGRRKRFGTPASIRAVGLLAREVIGLRYDPDAIYRLEGQRILDRHPPDLEVDAGHGLDGLRSAFRHTEITFEISHDSPPLADRGLIGPRIAAGSLITTGLLGDYKADLGRVVLYENAIAECANKLALQARHVGSVTLIHETIHALTHLGRDLDGRMWPEFSLPAANSLLFEPSWFHETVAQIFTYHHLVRLRDPALLHAFETMSDKQAPAYQTWRQLRNVPAEDVRSWFMSVRRGVGASGIQVPFPRI